MSSGKSMAGKVVLVTGGARGIGWETCLALGQLGATVVVGARRIDQAQSAADSLISRDLKAEGMALDVSSESDRQSVFAYLDHRYGRLDVLVNNAGIWRESKDAATPAEKLSSQISQGILRETFESNFFGPVFLTQLLLPLIRKSDAGRIVNVSSIRGSLTLLSDPGSPVSKNKTLAYDSSKTALNAFTIELADELRDTKIKVNAIHPGWVRTDMGSQEADLDAAEGARTSVMFACLPDDGPTGGFFYLNERLPW